MSDTMSISTDEIEAVAAKVDGDEVLDEHDKLVLRAVFLLAGLAVTTDLEGEGGVEGFMAPGGPMSLNFAAPLLAGGVGGSFAAAGKVSSSDFHFTHHYDKASPNLFLS